MSSSSKRAKQDGFISTNFSLELENLFRRNNRLKSFISLFDRLEKHHKQRSDPNALGEHLRIAATHLCERLSKPYTSGAQIFMFLVRKLREYQSRYAEDSPTRTYIDQANHLGFWFLSKIPRDQLFNRSIWAHPIFDQSLFLGFLPYVNQIDNDCVDSLLNLAQLAWVCTKKQDPSLTWALIMERIPDSCRWNVQPRVLYPKLKASSVPMDCDSFLVVESKVPALVSTISEMGLQRERIYLIEKHLNFDQYLRLVAPLFKTHPFVPVTLLNPEHIPPADQFVQRFLLPMMQAHEENSTHASIAVTQLIQRLKDLCIDLNVLLDHCAGHMTLMQTILWASIMYESPYPLCADCPRSSHGLVRFIEHCRLFLPESLPEYIVPCIWPWDHANNFQDQKRDALAKLSRMTKEPVEEAFLGIVESLRVLVGDDLRGGNADDKEPCPRTAELGSFFRTLNASLTDPLETLHCPVFPSHLEPLEFLDFLQEMLGPKACVHAYPQQGNGTGEDGELSETVCALPCDRVPKDAPCLRIWLHWVSTCLDPMYEERTSLQERDLICNRFAACLRAARLAPEHPHVTALLAVLRHLAPHLQRTTRAEWPRELVLWADALVSRADFEAYPEWADLRALGTDGDDDAAVTPRERALWGERMHAECERAQAEHMRARDAEAAERRYAAAEKRHEAVRRALARLEAEQTRANEELRSREASLVQEKATHEASLLREKTAHESTQSRLRACQVAHDALLKSHKELAGGKRRELQMIERKLLDVSARLDRMQDQWDNEKREREEEKRDAERLCEGMREKVDELRAQLQSERLTHSEQLGTYHLRSQAFDLLVQEHRALQCTLAEYRSHILATMSALDPCRFLSLPRYGAAFVAHSRLCPSKAYLAKYLFPQSPHAARHIREAAILARLPEHCGLAHPVTSFSVENLPFSWYHLIPLDEAIPDGVKAPGQMLLYPYVGVPLSSLTPGELQGEASVAQLLAQVLGVLRVFTEAGLVHRGICPGNLIVDTLTHRICVVGLGEALFCDPKTMHATPEQSWSEAPTRPPEIAAVPDEDDPLDYSRADIYATGLSFSSFFGRFDLHDHFEVLPELPESHSKLQGVLDQMVHVDPKVRLSPDQALDMLKERFPRELERY